MKDKGCAFAVIAFVVICFYLLWPVVTSDKDEK